MSTKKVQDLLFIGGKIVLPCIVSIVSWLKHLNLTLVCSAIAALTGIILLVITLRLLPAKPDIGQIKLHVSETVGKFWFLCQFVAKNSGGSTCNVNDVEILIDGCKEVTQSGSVEYASGQYTKGVRYFKTDLPEPIGRYDKENIVVVGTAQSQVDGDIPGGAEVKVSFQTKKKLVVISKRTNIISGGMSNYDPR